MSYPTKFTFVGSIPEVMLAKVPQGNVIINEYRNLPGFGARPMPDDLRNSIEEENKTKRGAKRKGKVGPSEVVKTSNKNVKKPIKKPRSPSLVVQEASESSTHSDFR